MRIISLIGLPGGGKSTVGRHLARRLGLAFTDADSVVEHRIGEPIRSFFEREGEAAFRDLEEQVIADLCVSAQGILATGGGAVLREANRTALRASTTVVFLRSAPEDIFRRLRHDTQRPLLQVPDPLARLRQLQVERDPLYLQTAHFIIDTGRPSIPMLVNMILMQLELAGVIDASVARSRAKPPADR